VGGGWWNSFAVDEGSIKWRIGVWRIGVLEGVRVETMPGFDWGVCVRLN
jgi:hypothetical protein